ncbi:MAG: CobD/CbiB family cobalamin biosynthesis protein [Methanobacteriaceae archaeon]
MLFELIKTNPILLANIIFSVLCILVFSVIFDLKCGELPLKIHPVVAIGNIIVFLKNKLKNIIKSNIIKNKFMINKIFGIIFFILTLISSYLIILCSLAIISLLDIIILDIIIASQTLFIYTQSSYAQFLLIIISISLLLTVILSSIILSSMFSIKMLISSAIGIKNDLSLSKKELNSSMINRELHNIDDVEKIAKSNNISNIEEARKSLSMLVSRDTSNLTRPQIISATIETLTENVVDSVTAPIFYYFLFSIFGVLFIILNPFNIFTNIFTNITTTNHINSIIINSIIIILLIIIAGIKGSVFYRVVNTLDAMIGYKDNENKDIGYFSAKLDDVLNYIPARLTGLFFVIASFILKMNYKNSYKIMRRDARNCPSPNSGFTMAATAGALNVQLEKKDPNNNHKNSNNKNFNKSNKSNNTSNTSNENANENSYKLGDIITFLETDNIDAAIKLSKLAIFLTTVFLAAIFVIILLFIFMI